MLSDLEHHDMPHKPHGLPANEEWPIDKMAPMPVHTGMVMLRTGQPSSSPLAHLTVDNLLTHQTTPQRQHKKPTSSGRIEESRLKLQRLLIRFRIRALGMGRNGNRRIRRWFHHR